MIAPANTGTPAKPIDGSGRPDSYRLANGKRVPSVTTITKRFADSSGLLIWANREGKAGRDLNEARDAAAEDGHVSHQWIVDAIHGRPRTAYAYTDAGTLAKAERALEAFQRWAAVVRLEIVATEIPLVSEALKFGGTLDAIGLVDGVLSLLDWKTGNRCYPEHVVQQSAYRELLREQARALGRPMSTVPDGAVLIRLDKDTGEPHARVFGADALDLGWTYFQRCRELYELDKGVSKLVDVPKAKARKGADAAAP